MLVLPQQGDGLRLGLRVAIICLPQHRDFIGCFLTSLVFTRLVSSMDIRLELSEIIDYYCRHRAAGVGVKMRLGKISSDVSVSRRINNNGLYFVLH